MIHRKIGNYKEAKRFFEKCIEFDLKHKAFAYLSRDYFIYGKYVDTIILIFYDGFFLIDTSLFLVAIAVLLLPKMPSLNQKFPRSKIKFNYVQVLKINYHLFKKI